MNIIKQKQSSMRRKVWFCILTALITGAMLLLAGGGIGVAQDAYPVGDVTVTPSTGACIGGSASFAGAGAPAGDEILVFMVHSPGEFPAATLGSTTANAAGTWSLTAIVPATGIGGNDQPTSITAGTYSVFASNQSDTYVAAGTLEVLNCAGKLPATGPQTLAMVLIGGALLAAAGVGMLSFRRSA